MNDEDFLQNYLAEYDSKVKSQTESNKNILDPFSFFKKYFPAELYQSEKTFLKVLYGSKNWTNPEMKMDEDDWDFLEWHEKNKGLVIEYRENGYDEGVLVVGRGAGKSFFTAGIDCYELYRILQIYDPNSFFMMPNTTLSLLFASASKDQGDQLFGYIKSIIMDCDLINKYIHGKPSADNIKLYTQKDLDTNSPPHILVKKLPSKSTSTRSYRSFLINLDELAHFVDNSGNFSSDSMYNAIVPSIKKIKSTKSDYFKFGKIVSMSSPKDKSGMIWRLYQLSQNRNAKILCMQLSTWEFDTSQDKKDFEKEFLLDPVRADMEYGANFTDSAERFFDPVKIDLMFDPNAKMKTRGDINIPYIFTIDLSKIKDRIAFVIGHLEREKIQGIERKKVIIDYMKKWEAKTVRLDDHSFKTIPPDYSKIREFIKDLPKLGYIPQLLAADQYNSTEFLQELEKTGIPCVETTFTNKYKEKIYDDLNESLMMEKIKCFGTVSDGESFKNSALEISMLELKYLQRIVKGKTTVYQAPTNGEITTDDFADAIANLNHLLITEDLSKYKIAKSITTKPIIARTKYGF